MYTPFSKNRGDKTVGGALVDAGVTGLVAFGSTVLFFGVLGIWAKHKEKKNKTID